MTGIHAAGIGGVRTFGCQDRRGWQSRERRKRKQGLFLCQASRAGARRSRMRGRELSGDGVCGGMVVAAQGGEALQEGGDGIRKGPTAFFGGVGFPVDGPGTDVAGVAVGVHGFGVVGINHDFKRYDSSHACLLLGVWGGAGCLGLMLSYQARTMPDFVFILTC